MLSLQHTKVLNKLKKLLKKILKLILPLVLGGFILVWVYKGFDFVRAKEVLFNQTNWWWMILSLVFGVLSHVFRGWRWKQTLEPLGEKPKNKNCVNAIFVSYAMNLVLPRVGEVSRCGVLKKYDNINFSKSLGTVVTERLIDTFCIGLITAITFFFQMSIFDEFFLNTGTNIESYKSLLTPSNILIASSCMIAIIILLIYLLKTLSFFEKVKGIVLNVWKGISSLKDVKNIPLFILYTLAIWGCYFLHFYLTFYCFSFTSHLSLMAGLVLFVCGTIAVIVPTPNGAGPWHFAIITMMTLYGIDAVDAGIFALIVHGIQTFLVALLGIYGMVSLPLINKK